MRVSRDTAAGVRQGCTFDEPQTFLTVGGSSTIETEDECSTFFFVSLFLPAQRELNTPYQVYISIKGGTLG